MPCRDPRAAEQSTRLQAAGDGVRRPGEVPTGERAVCPRLRTGAARRNSVLLPRPERLRLEPLRGVASSARKNAAALPGVHPDQDGPRTDFGGIGPERGGRALPERRGELPRPRSALRVRAVPFPSGTAGGKHRSAEASRRPAGSRTRGTATRVRRSRRETTRAGCASAILRVGIADDRAERRHGGEAPGGDDDRRRGRLRL